MDLTTGGFDVLPLDAIYKESNTIDSRRQQRRAPRRRPSPEIKEKKEVSSDESARASPTSKVDSDLKGKLIDISV